VNWPFAMRSTVDRLRLELFDERTRRKEAERTLAETQVELHRHKIVLGERSGVVKRLVTTP
jgi:hypothetical protein